MYVSRVRVYMCVGACRYKLIFTFIFYLYIASRLLSLTEIPLQRKLSYGSQESYMEFRLVELQSSTVGAVRGFHSMTMPMQRRSRSGSDNSLEDSTSIIPKEEGRVYMHISPCLFCNIALSATTL